MPPTFLPRADKATSARPTEAQVTLRIWLDSGLGQIADELVLGCLSRSSDSSISIGAAENRKPRAYNGLPAGVRTEDGVAAEIDAEPPRPKSYAASGDDLRPASA